MGVDTQALRWFQLVADGVTVTEVSHLEGVAQSGVSRALARLEREVGTPLLRRSGRVLRMTHAGAAFKHHVDAVMHELDDGLAAVHQVLDPETGTVTVSFLPCLGTWLVPQLVAGFTAAHPTVQVDLRPARDELTTAVGERSDVDLDLTSQRPTGPAVAWHRLVREPLLLAVPEHHPLATRAAVSLEEAAAPPAVTLRRGSALRRSTEDLWAAAGLRPEVAFECDDSQTATGFVAAGLGVAVLPAARTASAVVTDDGVRRLPLADARAARDVGMAWCTRRRMLPAAQAFRAHVVDQVRSGRLGPASQGVPRRGGSAPTPPGEA